jgi:hypothetical protein
MAKHLQTFAPLFIVLGIIASVYVLIATPRAAALSTTLARVEPIAKAKASFPLSRTVTSIASGRPPIPLLLSKHEEYFVQDVLQPTGTDSQEQISTPPQVTALKMSDDATPSDGGAKAMIEGDGYKGVTALAKGQDGKWRGRAMRGATEVAVTVDDRGNVSTE